ncbi:MAG TPA: FHA domain-containing protein [Burkholderiaceae bacterium]|nr:FHA domain-containing protein [Burkholderiaceae bacterium]
MSTTLPWPRRDKAAAPAWCLRFLGGPLRGRTLTLKAGANTLGSSAECEVLLPGGDVLPRHLVLQVGEVVVSLQKIGTASARLNGEDLLQPRRSVVAGDVISVGRIEFQLDRAYPAAEREDPLFAGPQSVLPESAPPQAPAAVRHPAGRWMGASVAALALLGLAGLALRGAAGDGPPGLAPLNLAEVERALAPFPETEVQALPGGTFNVKGYVETRQRRQSLREAMAPFGRRVSVNVHAAEEMVEQARRYLGDPAIAITYEGRGRLVVSGTVDDETVRQKVRRLGEDLHPNVLVADKVQVLPRPAQNEAEALTQAAAWQRLLPAPVVSIGADASGRHHIQLANGSRYYEGAVLRSGAVLTRIDVEGVSVRNGFPAAGQPAARN